MAVSVKIPTPLQRLTKGEEVVEGKAGTVIELVKHLDGRYPGIGERLSEEGKVRRFVNIYVNEEDIRFLQAEQTVVKDGDEVSIVPAIAGGNIPASVRPRSMKGRRV
jgi:molybdopterin synthase sulfur carrier subunit